MLQLLFVINPRLRKLFNQQFRHKFIRQGSAVYFDIFKQIVVFVYLNLYVLVFNHLPMIVVFYHEPFSNNVFNSVFEDKGISYILLHCKINRHKKKSLDNALCKVWRHTLFAWVQTSICFAGHAWVEFRICKCQNDFVHVQQDWHVFLPGSKILIGEDFNFRDVRKQFC